MNRVSYAVAAIVALFYLIAFIVDRSAGVLFALLFLAGAAMAWLRRAEGQRSFGGFLKTWWPLHLAMAGPLLAVIINQLVTGQFAGRSFDAPLRLALFPLIFLALQSIPERLLKHLQWAWIVGAFAAALKMYLLSEGGKNRYGTDFIPIIIFAEWTLLLGFFCVLSIGWNRRDETLLIVLKIAAACAVLYADYMSQSRGTWMTIPVFAVIGYFVIRNERAQKRLLLAIIASLLVFAVSAYHFGDAVKNRVADAQNDIRLYISGANVDTSLGIRFQLWRGSWLLYKRHPLVGVGIENFPAALEQLSLEKVVTPLAAKFPHSHNELLFIMSRLGTFGLLALLGLYFVPFAYFLREMRSDDMTLRSTAGMGLLLCLGFFTLGWVDVVFLWWEAFPFYSISIALFLSIIMRRKAAVLTGPAKLAETQARAYSKTCR